jgi:hypothetical protein
MVQETYSVSITNTSLMNAFREIFALCFENSLKHMNVLCRQDAKLSHVKAGGIYSEYFALKQWYSTWGRRRHIRGYVKSHQHVRTTLINN